MGKRSKKRKNLGPGPCDCDLINEGKPISSDVLACSACGFVAELVPQFSESSIAESEMKRIFRDEWKARERETYAYLFDLMKPLEVKPLQAARTAFLKVEEWRERGVLT